MCDQGFCMNGCRSHSDCPDALSCTNGECVNPCLFGASPCGINALCRVSTHRAVCICPEGYQGEPSQECYQLECRRDDDCEPNKQCSEFGVCTNPCLNSNACGVNAQCKVVNRRAKCSCPPGHYGNPAISCKKSGDECLKRPCGQNAKCKETFDGYMCSCLPGCYGDPHRGCSCDRAGQVSCTVTDCGVNAACRIQDNQPQCYCPPEFPLGDPLHACTYREIV